MLAATVQTIDHVAGGSFPPCMQRLSQAQCDTFSPIYSVVNSVCSRCVTWQLRVGGRSASGTFPLTRWHVTVLRRFPRPPTDQPLIIPELVQSCLLTSSFSFQILWFFFCFYADPPGSHDPNFSFYLSSPFIGPNWWSDNGKVFRLDAAALLMTVNPARKNQPIKRKYFVFFSGHIVPMLMWISSTTSAQLV